MLFKLRMLNIQNNSFCMHSLNSCAVVLIVLSFTSCLPHPGSLSKLPNDIDTVQSRDVILLNNTPTRKMTVQYLGAGGLYFLNNNGGILIDPFFSNQKISTLSNSVLWNKKNVQPNERDIQFGMKAISSETGPISPQLQGIFITHSHYDHLLDVPAVFEMMNKQPKVYLNQSGYNICYNVIDTVKMEVLENHMTTQEMSAANAPIVLETATGKVNVYPILADHNPHIKNIKFFDGDVTQPNTCFTKPYCKTNANDWLEGNTFSFVIDYLDRQGNIDLRFFIQSSSCNPMAGIPPKTIPEHKVDIAFLGIASYEASPNYPAALIKALDPTKIVWIHWEDFFRKYTKEPKTVRATNVPGFFKLDAVAVDSIRKNAYLPWPRAIFEVNY